MNCSGIEAASPYPASTCLRAAHAPHVAFASLGPDILALLGGVQGVQKMGGAELQTALYGRLLRDRGWQVTFIVDSAAGQPADYEHDGFRFLTGYTAHYQGEGLRQPIMRIRGARFWIKNVPRFWRAMRQADADIYFFRGATRLLAVAAWFCKRHRRALVFSAASNRDLGDQTERVYRAGAGSLFRYGLRQARVVFVQHQEQKRMLRCAKGQSVELLPNISAFPIGPPQTPRDNIVLWAAAMSALKRPLLALEVAEAVPEATFKFVYWTSPARHSRLAEQFATRAAAIPNVELVGFVPHQDLQTFFREAKVLLHTSPPGSEGFPNVYLEAWSQGVPVVGCFDADDVVVKHGLGRIAEDRAGLVSSLRELLSDETERLELAGHAVEYVRQHHNTEAVGATLIAALTTLL